MNTCKWRLKPGDIVEYRDRLDLPATIVRRVFDHYDSTFPDAAHVTSVDGEKSGYIYIGNLIFTRIIRAPK